MKTHEKIITVLITLSLFVCLCLTGQSVLRTAARFSGQFTRHTAKPSPKASEATIGGICGNNLRWTFADGILTISGKGQMHDYTDALSPWAALTITTVRVKKGVTSISARAFSHNRLVRHVLLPSTLKSIDADAFARTRRLPDIYVARENTRFTSFAGVLFHRDERSPVINPVGKQRISYPFPAALRQITSCILFFALYLQTTP